MVVEVIMMTMVVTMDAEDGNTDVKHGKLIMKNMVLIM